MSFKDEAEKTIFKAIYGDLDEHSPAEAEHKFVSQLVTSIINLVDKELPKTIKKVPHSETQKKLLHYAEGYNQAIDDMRAIIRKTNGN
jgi:hypothetical protein